MNLRTLLFFSVLFFCGQPGAAEVTYPIITLRHTAWTAQEGAPGRVSSMAQTPDGWLWFATTRGLFRFDGVSFEKYQRSDQPLTSTNVAMLGTLPSGALWIGYRFGGLSLLEHGKITHFGPKQGLMRAVVKGVVEDRDKGVWIGTTSGMLYRPAGAAVWQPYVMDGVSAAPRVISMLLDDDGTLWVRTLEATLARRRGETAFRRVADGGSYGQLSKAPDGSVWMCDLDRAGIQMLRPPSHGAAPQFPGLPASSYLLFDREGNAWVAPTREYGIMRIERDGKTDRATKLDEPQGLTGTVNSVLLDLEGNVWIGTGKGVDRFRPTRMKAVETPDYLADGRPMAAGPDGSLRIDRYIIEHPGQAGQSIKPIGPPETAQNIVTNVYSDPDGSFWVGGLSGVAHIVDGKRIDIDPPVPGPKTATIAGIVKDRKGALWVLRGRPYRYANGVWAQGGDIAALREFFANGLLCDSRGRIWFGGLAGSIAILDGDQVTMLGAADGLTLGSIKHIVERDGQFWIGGENGVARYDGKHFFNLAGEGNEPFSGASGLVFDATGALWINGLDGISGVAKAELDQALRDASHRVNFERYDFLDGLNGTPSQFAQTPTALMGSDGKMWFSTTYGIYHLDPYHITRNRHVPTVLVRSLRAGATVFDTSTTSTAPTLPPGTTAAQIDYTALSLTMPERVRFRYRLDGVDSAWQDPGRRRSAFYTGLAPGNYHFHVIGSNNDGVWNQTGAGLDFTILPTFSQTIWFKLLCALAAGAVLYGAYRWRIGQVTRRTRERLQARLSERERIARALHDTLLQGVQILTLRFQHAIDRLPADIADRRQLEQALDAADQVVAEARDQVMDLRSTADMDAALQAMLRELAASLGYQQQVVCSARVLGQPRVLQALVREEIFGVAREAVINALQHAQASRIEIVLDYRATSLVLSVSDDGCGIDAAILQSGERSGHWGLPGMRERAAELKGRLQIASSAQSGTAIVLEIAAHLAYSASAAPTPWSRLKRWLRR